jgi:hypothetical protein
MHFFPAENKFFDGNFMQKSVQKSAQNAAENLFSARKKEMKNRSPVKLKSSGVVCFLLLKVSVKWLSAYALTLPKT